MAGKLGRPCTGQRSRGTPGLAGCLRSCLGSFMQAGLCLAVQALVLGSLVLSLLHPRAHPGLGPVQDLPCCLPGLPFLEGSPLAAAAAYNGNDQLNTCWEGDVCMCAFQCTLQHERVRMGPGGWGQVRADLCSIYAGMMRMKIGEVNQQTALIAHASTMLV